MYNDSGLSVAKNFLFIYLSLFFKSVSGLRDTQGYSVQYLKKGLYVVSSSSIFQVSYEDYLLTVSSCSSHALVEAKK